MSQFLNQCRVLGHVGQVDILEVCEGGGGVEGVVVQLDADCGGDAIAPVRGCGCRSGTRLHGVVFVAFEPVCVCVWCVYDFGCPVNLCDVVSGFRFWACM